MNTTLNPILLMILVIILIAEAVFAHGSNTPMPEDNHLTENNKLKKEALKILELKCNFCHKKQNPFMMFKEKNLEKKASKINQMVFIERKMPKGDENKLSKEEYNQLKLWLVSLKIY